MNDLTNIMSMLIGATPGVGQDALSGLQGTDATDFLNFLLQPDGDATALPADLAALTDILPVDMLRAKLADLLKQEAPAHQPVVTDADLGIQPSLTQDLMAKFVEYLQPRTVMPGTPLAQEMAATLEIDTNTAPKETHLTVAANNAALVSDVEDVADVAEATPQTKIQAEATTPVIDDHIMSILKDKVAALQTTGADSRKLEDAKKDMIRIMEDQGLDSSEIHAHLGALAQFLRQETPTLQTQAMTPALKTVGDAVKTAPVDADITADAALDPAGKKPLLNAETPQKDLADAPQQKLPAQDARAKVAGLQISPETMRALADGNSAQTLTSNVAAKQDIADITPFGKILDNAAQPQHMINHMSTGRTISGETVTQMVSLQLQHNAQNQTRNMTLQLNPAELGHLDIKMTFEKDGQMRAHLSVEKPETLALLQRDTVQLERTLQQAGLKLDEQSISLDLRQQQQETFGGTQHEQHAKPRHHGGLNDITTLQAAIAVETPGYVSSGGVNIMI